MDSLTNSLNGFFGQKAPALPPAFKQFLVTIAPWLAIISVLFLVPAVFALLSISVALPFAALGGYAGQATSSMAGLAFSLAAGILELMAIPGLFKKTRSAWNLMYWAALLNFAGGIVSLSVIGAVVGFAVSAYILFQVRSYYI